MNIKSLCLLLLMFFSSFSMAEEIEATENQNAEIVQLAVNPKLDIFDLPRTNSFTVSFASQSNQPTFAAECCKVCRKGKACGDSCISKTKTCNVGPGCACDG